MPKFSDRALAMGELAIESFRLNGPLLAVGDALGRDQQMTSARWQVLGTIQLAKSPLSVARIARRMGLKRQSVQRVADCLAEQGLLTWQDNPEHRRAKLALLTPGGTAVLEELERRRSLWADEAAADLTAEELRNAATVLRRLRRRIKSTHPDK